MSRESELQQSLQAMGISWIRFIGIIVIMAVLLIILPIAFADTIMEQVGPMSSVNDGQGLGSQADKVWSVAFTSNMTTKIKYINISLDGSVGEPIYCIAITNVTGANDLPLSQYSTYNDCNDTGGSITDTEVRLDFKSSTKESLVNGQKYAIVVRGGQVYAGGMKLNTIATITTKKQGYGDWPPTTWTSWLSQTIVFRIVMEEAVLVISNQRNYTNDKLVYTFSAQSDQTGACSLWGNWSGIWIMNETKSVTAATSFNFTAITLPSDKNYFWGINCSESTLGRQTWGNNITFSTKTTIVPVISNLNCTSNVENLGTETNGYFNSTGDLTPTFSMTTDINANIEISNSNSSGWITCNPTGTTSHICTINWADKLSTGFNQVYFRINRTDNNGVGYKNITVWTMPAGTVSGDRIEAIQYLAIASWNNTHLVFNRTIQIFNFYADAKIFTIPELSGWTLASGTNPMEVDGQHSNKTVYQTTAVRGMADEPYNVSAFSTTGTTTDVLDFYDMLPVDPPFKLCDFSESRRLTDTIFECETLTVRGSALLDLINTQVSIAQEKNIENGSMIVRDTNSRITIG